MSKNMEFVRSAVAAEKIRGAAEATGMAIVLTDGELVAGRSGLFGRWGSKLQRYDLSQLREVRSVAYPAANMLILNFIGTPPQSAAFMYDRGATSAFEPILAALQQQATSNGGAQAH